MLNDFDCLRNDFTKVINRAECITFSPEGLQWKFSSIKYWLAVWSVDSTVVLPDLLWILIVVAYPDKDHQMSFYYLLPFDNWHALLDFKMNVKALRYKYYDWSPPQSWPYYIIRRKPVKQILQSWPHPQKQEKL